VRRQVQQQKHKTQNDRYDDGFVYFNPYALTAQATESFETNDPSVLHLPPITFFFI
jgi:hypothetical protein